MTPSEILGIIAIVGVVCFTVGLYFWIKGYDDGYAACGKDYEERSSHEVDDLLGRDH